jgi:IS30 family transposase
MVRSHPEDPAMRISHETIYKHVYLDKRRGGSLHTRLRPGRKRRQKRGNTTGRRGNVPNRTPIHERPKVVETQSRDGDCEGDTNIGRNQQGAVATFVDRKNLYIVANHMPNRTAEALNRVAAVAFKAIPASIRHTLTVDNGKEFSGFKAIEEALGLGVYFADPYASWQRAINENTNGLLRQYISKKTDMRDVSPEDLKAYMHKLNNRPRKKFGYRTPAEVLQEIGVEFEP